MYLNEISRDTMDPLDLFGHDRFAVHKKGRGLWNTPPTTPHAEVYGDIQYNRTAAGPLWSNPSVTFDYEELQRKLVPPVSHVVWANMEPLAASKLYSNETFKNEIMPSLYSA